MWSGWPERVDVYLGAGTVLVKRRARALVSLRPPATLPLGDVLAQVDEACERSQDKPWRLHVALGAAMCPPVTFTLSQGVKRWSETVALAQAAAAQAWGLPADQADALVCALDAGRKGLAAALMRGAHDLIGQWAGSHRGRLVSLAPVWALATQAPACRAMPVRQLTVHEPGAIAAVQDAGLPGAGLEVRFSVEVLPLTQQWMQGPAAWAGHWERLA
ncbi:MAG: hypothetical protein AB7S86_05850 [Hydrogenophaga sp.]|uniref:hypothetical protein n=1 Tax=Hydrogenophaga sp. TaxID=1904254 RepID=UPI003D10350E